MEYAPLEMTPFAGRQQRMVGELDASGPPNLRPSDGMQSCADCKNFDGDGACMKYGNAAVDESQVCDGYSSAGV